MGQLQAALPEVEMLRIALEVEMPTAGRKAEGELDSWTKRDMREGRYAESEGGTVEDNGCSCSGKKE